MHRMRQVHEGRPYGAIIESQRPCVRACVPKAITIGDKSCVPEALRLLKDSKNGRSYPLYAVIAPSFAAQPRKKNIEVSLRAMESEKIFRKYMKKPNRLKGNEIWKLSS